MVAVDWSAVVLLQLSFAVDSETCARVYKYAVVRNRVTHHRLFGVLIVV